MQQPSNILQRLVDSMPLLACYVDANGCYQLNNAAYEKWFGLAKGEIRGRHVREVVGEGAYLAIKPHLDAALSGRKASFEAELPYRRGGMRYVLVEYIPDTDEAGVTHGFFAVITDLPERRRNEQEIERLNAELRQRLDEMHTIFEAAPIGIFVSRDSDCRTMVANRAGRRMLHLRRDLEPSKTGPNAEQLGFRVFSRGKELPPEQLPMQVAARTGQTLSDCEIELRFDDGSATILSSCAAPLRAEDGQVRGCIGTFSDVTEAHRAARALADMDRRKNSFLATLAHELRNPLAAIAQTLQAGTATALDAKALAILRRQTHHLTKLVDDLMDVSRITRGMVHLDTQPLRLDELLAAVIETAASGLQARGQAATLDLGVGGVWIDGDAVRLTQVFSNLLSNASKYSPPGASIEVVLRRDGGEALVEVRDQGRGIRRSDLPFLFDPFVQIAGAEQGPDAGLGLGLALVRQLVQLHGGTVAAASDGPGQGSCFTVRLPVAEPQFKAVAPALEAPAAPELPAGLRVLIVEDNLDVADSLRMLLAAYDAVVHCVYAGQEAVSAVTEFAPEVVLLDLHMPGKDGMAVARELAALEARTGFLVIAMSGHAATEIQEVAAADSLFDAFLQKPIAFDALCEQIARHRRG